MKIGSIYDPSKWIWREWLSIHLRAIWHWGGFSFQSLGKKLNLMESKSSTRFECTFWKPGKQKCLSQEGDKRGYGELSALFFYLISYSDTSQKLNDNFA